MLSEGEVQIEQRYLAIEGKVSKDIIESVKSGLPYQKPDNSEILFVSYSYADIPLGKNFDRVFIIGDTQCNILSKSKIAAVTQQFGKPFGNIPHGWKTICVIEFKEGVPELIKNLPYVKTWDDSKIRIVICSEETWQAMKQM